MSAPSELTLELRETNWDRLGSEKFDILIIGGGSVGVGAALDAATRGLKVAMVEARDLACGSSSRSSKMFHGGLRYLQPNPIPQFGLVAESLHERELSMHTLAPHLVKPLKFIYPLTKPFIERPIMFCGFTLYDRMGGAKTVPIQKHFSRKSILKKIPSLKPKATCGGVQYYDTLVDDARHTMMVGRTAAKYGAVIRTSTQVIDFLKEGDRIVGVTIKDTEDGRTENVHASAVINATGVWTDEMQDLAGAKAAFHVHQSKGIHIVVPKECIKSDSALCFVTEKSVLFVIPWGNYWIVGTTDTSYKLDLAHPAATKTDIDYVLDELNSRLQEPVTYADIVGVYAGLRPLVAQAGQENTEKLARNHEVAHLCPGLVSVAGEYLKKGRSVYVEGRLKTRKWQDKEGRDTYTTEIIAQEMQLLGGREGMGGGDEAGRRAQIAVAVTRDDVALLRADAGGFAKRQDQRGRHLTSIRASLRRSRR